MCLIQFYGVTLCFWYRPDWDQRAPPRFNQNSRKKCPGFTSETGTLGKRDKLANNRRVDLGQRFGAVAQTHDKLITKSFNFIALRLTVRNHSNLIAAHDIHRRLPGF